jgi:peptide/nickel transport system substrate-binding protein
LAKSGYSGQTIKLTYPSDFALDGIAFSTLAQKVQTQLQAVGIKVTLSGVPVDTMLASYRADKLQAGMIYWGPDFPDPSDYLTFSAGGSLAAARVGWTADKAPTVTAAAEAAQAAVTPADRATAYEAWGKAMNTVGPFVPFLQAARYFVTSSTVSNVLPNAVWTVDLASIK